MVGVDLPNIVVERHPCELLNRPHHHFLALHLYFLDLGLLLNLQFN